MYNQEQYKALENKSHIRGLLSKEFYSEQQAQQERKRHQMKLILDQQVQQRKKQKERQKNELDEKIRNEEIRIKNYYDVINNRSRQQKDKDKQVSSSNTPYSPPSYSGRQMQQFIPVMPPLYLDQQNYNRHQKNNNFSQGIPLLDLKEKEDRTINFDRDEKEKYQKNFHSKKNKQKQKLSYNISQNSSGQLDTKQNPTKNNQHFVFNQQNFNEHQTIQEEHQKKLENNQKNQLQNKNNSLKLQLKKSQEAISLLIGAVRSNPRLDKYRVQAQHILRGGISLPKINALEGNNVIARPVSNKQAISFMLPKINVKGPSLMHDYLLSAALQKQPRRKTHQNQL